MPKIRKGHVVALFAFDFGLEIALDRLDESLGATPAPPLSQKKQTPPYLQYTTPPRVADLGRAAPLAGEPGGVQATIFDFGAVSIAYRWPLAAGTRFDELPRLSAALPAGNLEAQARADAERLAAKIQAAVKRPALSPLVEDYYLFVIEEFDEPQRGGALLADQRATLAQVLRFETQPLSPEQQEEAVGQHISYYDCDLVVVDWNAAVIYDRDYWDTANVLELLNVELLEARYTDAQLDRRIEEYQQLVRRRTMWPLPLRTPYRRAIEELAERHVESMLLAERVENALKLIGDLYLARVHAAATARFYLPEWESSIARKLAIIDHFYDLLIDRVRTAQSQTLELIVIALIFAEIILAFFR